MAQLLLTILAIALTAAVAVASINYIPWWTKTAANTEEQIQTSLRRIDRAYSVLTIANNGVPPATNADSDGGFTANFTGTLKLSPAAPNGFSWSYGTNSSSGTPWSGLSWVCLKGSSADKGQWVGAMRAGGLYSSQQYILNTTCGATSSMSEPTTFPATAAVTYYLTYLPEISP